MCETSSWHGTMTATLLACNPWSSAASGFTGALPDSVQVLPVRVLGACKRGYASDVADAIVWAAGGEIQGLDGNKRPERRADVILMPFSGYSAADEGGCPSYLESAVRLAASRNVTLVASGGNNYGDSASNYFPANCMGVMSVGALNRQGERASYSNVDTHIHMPGGDSSDPLVCMSNAGIIRPCTGTSFAAAYAAAWAASIILERGFFEFPSVRKPPGLLAMGHPFVVFVPKDSEGMVENITAAHPQAPNALVEGSSNADTCNNNGYRSQYWYSITNALRDCPVNSCMWGVRRYPFDVAYLQGTIWYEAYEAWKQGNWYMDEFCTPLPGYYAYNTRFCSTNTGDANLGYTNGDARPTGYCYRYFNFLHGNYHPFDSIVVFCVTLLHMLQDMF